MIEPSHVTIVGVADGADLLEKYLSRIWCGGHVVDKTEAELALSSLLSGSPTSTEERLTTYDFSQQSCHTIALLDGTILDGRWTDVDGRVPVRRSVRS